jgi:hypothetical protein
MVSILFLFLRDEDAAHHDHSTQHEADRPQMSSGIGALEAVKFASFGARSSKVN